VPEHEKGDAWPAQLYDLASKWRVLLCLNTIFVKLMPDPTPRAP
jgi:hypothetical protein